MNHIPRTLGEIVKGMADQPDWDKIQTRGQNSGDTVELIALRARIKACRLTLTAIAEVFNMSMGATRARLHGQQPFSHGQRGRLMQAIIHKEQNPKKRRKR